MVRTLILGCLLLAGARGAVADQATATPGTPAPVVKIAGVAAVSAAAESVDTTKTPSRRQSVAAKPAHVRTDAPATASPEAQTGDVKMSGMSILGNEDTPKALALVPWKSSQLGELPSVSRLLDSSAQPVDKDVFMRELAYYSFKSGAN